MLEYGVDAAFLPSPVAGDVGAPEAFEWVVSTNLTLEEAQAQVWKVVGVLLGICA